MDIKNIVLFIIFMSCFFIACFSPQKQDLASTLFNEPATSLEKRGTSDQRITDASAWEEFIVRFDAAIKNKTDRKPFANLCRFPFDFIESQDEFLVNFDAYFSPELLHALETLSQDGWDENSILYIDLATQRYKFYAEKRGNKYYLVDITIENL